MNNVCSFCKMQIPYGTTVCRNCGARLTAEKRSTIDELIAALPDTDPRAGIDPLTDTEAGGAASNSEGMK